MTKYCPVCGYPNPDNALFCARCGYRFPQPAQPPATPQPVQPGPAQQQPPQQYPPQYPQGPASYPPPPPQGPSTLEKIDNINRKLLSPFAGLLTGLEIILIGIGFLLLYATPFTLPGGAGPFSGAFGAAIGAFAIYVIVGLLVLILGVKRSFSGSLTFILGFMTFLYFIILAVSTFLLYQGIKGALSQYMIYVSKRFLNSLLSSGVELVIGSVFLLIAVIMGRPTSTPAPGYQQAPYYQYPAQGGGIPIGKIIAYVFGLIAAILIYVGLGGTSGGSQRLYQVQFPITDLVGAAYFGSSLAVVAGIIAPIGLMVLLFIGKSNTGKRAAYMVLEFALLIFGVGQILLGAGTVSSGLPNTSGLPQILSSSFYLLYAGGIVDLIAGILVLILSIMLIVEEALKLTGSSTTYYYQPPPPPSSGMPPSS